MATFKPRRKLEAVVTAPPANEQSTVVVDIPYELIREIISYLNVKTLMRFRTVCKAWKTLISNPTFVNLHLQRSPRNTHLTLKRSTNSKYSLYRALLSFFPVSRLLENPPIIASFNEVEMDRDELWSYNFDLTKYNCIVGSCNGLVCFYSSAVYDAYPNGYSEYSLNFQNLAMGTRFHELGRFRESYTIYSSVFNFSFGYDNSNGTYKVVAFRGQHFHSPSWTSQVKIFNLGDNSWRSIQSFPVPPLICYGFGHSEHNDAVHFFGTINWLALTNTSGALRRRTHINAESLVILSLSLSTEKYTQLLLPEGFNDDLHVQPTLRVLRNCLCFSHDFRGTEFVIWQMKEFGVRESWTQLIKVSYQTLRIQNLPRGDHMYKFQLLPLYLSDNSNTLIFANAKKVSQALIYNRKDDRVERTRISKIQSWFSTMDYVESLVSIA